MTGTVFYRSTKLQHRLKSDWMFPKMERNLCSAGNCHVILSPLWTPDQSDSLCSVEGTMWRQRMCATPAEADGFSTSEKHCIQLLLLFSATVLLEGRQQTLSSEPWGVDSLSAACCLYLCHPRRHVDWVSGGGGVLCSRVPTSEQRGPG